MVVELKKGVTIDPGHGGVDPGAVGNGFREKDLTLQISLYQYKRFKELGVPVGITRANDSSLDSTPRTAQVKQIGYTHCISNHINAGGGEGVEVIHSIQSSDVLAMKIARAITAVGHKFRRVFSKKGSNGLDYYYMHRQTGAVKTLIIEYGFIDNITDIKRLQANILKYAEAVVQVMCEELGYKYVPQGGIKKVEDTKAHWAHDSIEKVKALGIMTGRVDGAFDPDGKLTRAELATALDRLIIYIEKK